MIIVLKADVKEEAIEKLIDKISGQGLIVHDIKRGGVGRMLGLVGDIPQALEDSLDRVDIVESVLKVREPYKLSGRRFHPEDTVVSVVDAKIGGGNFAVIAGRCSVESEEQILSIARDISNSDAKFLRGGCV